MFFLQYSTRRCVAATTASIQKSLATGHCLTRPGISYHNFRLFSSANPIEKPNSSISMSEHCITQARRKRIIVAMTGATGSILGIRILQTLKRLNVETHLVISKWAEATIKYETDFQPIDVRNLADYFYSNKDVSAPISSGSFHTDGMIVVPCSMKSLAGIRTGYSEDLIARAADVILKERKQLIMVVRETPLSDIHLKNMLALTRTGAIIFPPVPAFYTKPQSLEDMIQQSVGRILDQLNIDTAEFERWTGFQRQRTASSSP